MKRLIASVFWVFGIIACMGYIGLPAMGAYLIITGIVAIFIQEREA